MAKIPGFKIICEKCGEEKHTKALRCSRRVWGEREEIFVLKCEKCGNEFEF